MIIQTTRIRRDGGVRYLARHLLDKTVENERIDVLAGDRRALDDAQALALAKGCRYSVRHFSVSPERSMSPTQLSGFLQAINIEFGIGADRPRLVVRHVKGGRAHFHIVVAEVDPKSFRVLDCRNDFARLEMIARNYEADQGETVQPTRAERRRLQVAGFSDVARKRAERKSRDFDRAALRTALANGRAALGSELDRQGLRIQEGDKGYILVTAGGEFVAAACRAVGASRAEFRSFMNRENGIGSIIGSEIGPSSNRGKHGDVCITSPTSSSITRDARAARSSRSTAGHVAPYFGYATAAGRHFEILCRSTGPLGSSIGFKRRREELQLHRLGGLNLDDLLRRAQELAGWIRSIFEPPIVRLTREIENARTQKSFPPLRSSDTLPPVYHYRGRSPL